MALEKIVQVKQQDLARNPSVILVLSFGLESQITLKIKNITICRIVCCKMF